MSHTLIYAPERVVTKYARINGDPVCNDCGRPVVEGIDAHTVMVHNRDRVTSRTSTVEISHDECGAQQIPGAFYIREAGRRSVSYA